MLGFGIPGVLQMRRQQAYRITDKVAYSGENIPSPTNTPPGLSDRNCVYSMCKYVLCRYILEYIMVHKCIHDR